MQKKAGLEGCGLVAPPRRGGAQASNLAEQDLKLVPGGRIGLPTPRFSVVCSTTELPRQKVYVRDFNGNFSAKQLKKLPR